MVCNFADGGRLDRSGVGGRVSEEDEVRDGAEEERVKGDEVEKGGKMTIEGYRMEEEEVTRRRAEVQGDIRKKSPESVPNNIIHIQEESVRKRATRESGSQDKDDRKMTGRLGSRSLATTTLKRKVTEIKKKG